MASSFLALSAAEEERRGEVRAGGVLLRTARDAREVEGLEVPRVRMEVDGRVCWSGVFSSTGGRGGMREEVQAERAGVVCVRKARSALAPHLRVPSS